MWTRWSFDLVRQLAHGANYEDYLRSQGMAG
jgi:hypothetical protein